MKKIIGSVGMLALVGALVWGATGAFFSDTETSTGNTFTAGEIDLTVDSEQHYNGNVCQKVVDDGDQIEYEWVGSALYPVPGTACDGSWEATDLGAQMFFNFADLKPGDSGENTISLNVDNNDAWMCAGFTTTGEENGLTEPETDLEDNDTYGELGKYLEIMWWADNGDNKLGANEVPLYGGPRTLDGWLVITGGANGNGFLPLTISDSQVNALGQVVGTPVSPDSTIYFAVAWCLGDMTPTAGEGDGFTCDGSSVLNDSQTDEITAALDFSVEQFRNNANFLCAEHR